MEQDTQPKSQKDFLRLCTVVPPEWKPKIERLARAKGYFSIGEFLRDLIRDQIEKKQREGDQ